jgi:cyclophilin family peptidyl-prolyl cis-trans isomerase
MSIKILMLSFIGLAVVADSGARAANPIAIIETSMGTIKVELDQEKAPITVKNFLDYAESKHYDGTIFHRVMGKENSDRDFMIQCGGFEPGMKQKKVKAAIKNEASNGLSNKRGTLAMARTNDPDSATSQFFINVADNEFLNKSPRSDGYAVFGKVTEGMDVVDKIKAVPTGNRGGHGNVPKDDITIKSVKIEKK